MEGMRIPWIRKGRYAGIRYGMEAGMRDYSMDDYSRKVTPEEIKSAMAQSCANCKKYKLWSCFYLARYGYDLEHDGWCMGWQSKR